MSPAVKPSAQPQFQELKRRLFATFCDWQSAGASHRARLPLGQAITTPFCPCKEPRWVLMLSCPLPGRRAGAGSCPGSCRRRWPARSRGGPRRSGTLCWRRAEGAAAAGPAAPAVAGRLLHARAVPAGPPAVPGHAEGPGRGRPHRAGSAGHDGADRCPAQARGKAAGTAAGLVPIKPGTRLRPGDHVLIQADPGLHDKLTGHSSAVLSANSSPCREPLRHRPP
jgi:hypothetical protein